MSSASRQREGLAGRRVIGRLLAPLLLAGLVAATASARASAPPLHLSVRSQAARHVEQHKAELAGTLPLLNNRPAGAPLLLANASPRAARIRATRRPSARPGWLGNRRGGLLRALLHRPRVVSANKAASLIRAGDRVFVPVGQVTSNVILKALAERARTGKGNLRASKPVQIVGLSNTAARSVFDREGKVVPRGLFLGANARDPVAAGRGEFVPAYFGRIPRLIREGKVPVDVAVVQVSAPDRLGFVTLGPTAGCTPAALEKAKTVIAQINKEVPRTRGATRIHISKLDYVVKADEPLVPVPPAEITRVDRKIASNVVRLIVGGATGAGKRAGGKANTPTFQFGIGGIPDAVAQQIACSTKVPACRIRSELIGPGTRKLVESGKVKGKVTYTFAMGDQDFLRWMNKNSKLVAQPVDVVNDPALIGKNPNVVAINSAMKVDLVGQVNAQYVKGEWYSGVGGQVDFMRGAMLSKGGKAIIAMPSTAEVSDGQGGKKLISKIVPRLGEGDVVTTNMHDLQYVVTEHGIANLEGKSDVQRARALIRIAHPRFRSELTATLEAQLQSRRQAEQKRYDRYLANKTAGSPVAR